MIRSFADKTTAALFSGYFVKSLPQTIQIRALDKLRMLDQARALRDLLAPTANRLEALKGCRSGQYSIRINDQWRVCFSFRDGDAFDVEIVDYH